MTIEGIDDRRARRESARETDDVGGSIGRSIHPEP
jgi:hypothetical protein